jgi:hypothetical protein
MYIFSPWTTTIRSCIEWPFVRAAFGSVWHAGLEAALDIDRCGSFLVVHAGLGTSFKEM